jgi:hypothetical protein
VFAIAKVLYRNRVEDEAQIIATMAYAARHGEYALEVRGVLPADTRGLTTSAR